MASPASTTGSNNSLGFGSVDANDAEGGWKSLEFKRNRLVNLMVAGSPLIMIPPGLSPSGFLSSPGFFSSHDQRFSNAVIGFLNLLTLLASVPIIGAGLWMARDTTTCKSLLQTPLLIIGFGVLVVSLAGFIGAWFRVTWALGLYLVIVLFLILCLMMFTVIGLVVTSKGGGVALQGRIYKEYRLEKYSPQLRRMIDDPKYWMPIKSCIFGSKTCAKLRFWTPYDYLNRNLSPIQSGCCKPPTACNYDQTSLIPQDPDCYKWNNAQNILCYDCDSCKAGVLENIKADLHKLSVLNIFLLVLLMAIIPFGCCALKTTKRVENRWQWPKAQRRTGWDFFR